MIQYVPVLIVFLVAVAGCSRGDAPATAPVKGVVTMAGKPLAGVGVTFLPTGPGPIASGNTNEKGEFTLRTVEPGDGAVIGSHKVVFGAAEEGPRKPGVAAIPAKYGNLETTDMTAEVKAGTTNEFAFELKP